MKAVQLQIQIKTQFNAMFNWTFAVLKLKFLKYCNSNISIFSFSNRGKIHPPPCSLEFLLLLPRKIPPPAAAGVCRGKSCRGERQHLVVNLPALPANVCPLLVQLIICAAGCDVRKVGRDAMHHKTT